MHIHRAVRHYPLAQTIFSGCTAASYSSPVMKPSLTTAGIGQYISPTLGIICSLILHEAVTREKLLSLAFIWAGIAFFVGFTLREQRKNKI